ncbi:MFS transporter [Streptacidiphilus pinicola]|uniref:MFS transporter n=1 Tax=Streptacidiphilus pinicola TaxID=2219663 RepID=A0A2X0KFE5_9ACTN|nr:MFS transporter [Streptacidiphilus pinicola]RAG85570.1 MFS transporter [Streptacidiphilus pinicola]
MTDVDDVGTGTEPGRRHVVLGVTAVVALLGSLDAYVIVTLLNPITDELGIPANHLERATAIVTAYLLGYVAAMPLLGQTADRFGPRRVLQCCLVGFAVGSVLTASAHSLPLLVAGRLVQGAAAGALLPVALALAGRLFHGGARPVALGSVGAAQELGSVLGPLYGAGVAALTGWRGVFWVNVPLVLVAAVVTRFVVPAEAAPESGEPAGSRRTDVVGGLLLAVALALLVAALDNQDPQRSVLPSWGPPMLLGSAVALAVFVLWERHSQVRLIDTRRIRRRPFAAAMAISFCAGVALLVTLVDGELVAQSLLGESSVGGALLLMWFLTALPVGAVLGGLAGRRLGHAVVAGVGMAVAAGGYLLIAAWPLAALTAHLGPLPLVQTDLVIAGLGLGLVIAPTAGAVLDSTDPGQHTTASAAAVIARTVGMLVGVAALSAWGLHRFETLTAHLDMPIPGTAGFGPAWSAYQHALHLALHTEYSDIFRATAVVCALGAVCALGLAGSASGDPAR